MKVLVTGGAGFIGSNVSKALLQQGAEVTILDNLSSGWEENLDALSAANFVRGDIRNQDKLLEAAAGCEVIFHLAASVGNKRSIDHPTDDTQINVNGTLGVLEAARTVGARKIVASSSAGIYGELKTIPITEHHPIEPLTPYAVSKLYTEKMSLAFANVYGVEAICLRYFNVYGPNQRFDAYGNVIPIFAFRALRGEPMSIFGDGEQTRDFVHVDDVVQANINAAMNKGTSGAFNIASGTQIRIIDLAKAINSHIDNAVAIEHTAERPGDVAHSLADISMAAKKLGFTPKVGIAEGLENYMKWAKKEVARQDG